MANGGTLSAGSLRTRAQYGSDVRRVVDAMGYVSCVLRASLFSSRIPKGARRVARSRSTTTLRRGGIPGTRALIIDPDLSATTSLAPLATPKNHPSRNSRRRREELITPHRQLHNVQTPNPDSVPSRLVVGAVERYASATGPPTSIGRGKSVDPFRPRAISAARGDRGPAPRVSATNTSRSRLRYASTSGRTLRSPTDRGTRSRGRE